MKTKLIKDRQLSWKERFQTKLLDVKIAYCTIHMTTEFELQIYYVLLLEYREGCSHRHRWLLIKWTRPPFPFIKVNVDGAVNMELDRRGLGAVLQRWDDYVLATTSKDRADRLEISPKGYLVVCCLFGFLAGKKW